MNLDNLKKKFEEVYQRESDAVFRFCIFRLSDRETCLELTQEVFMRYWDNISSGKEIKNDRAFLFTISRNLIIDHYRKKKSSSLDEIIEELEDSVSVLSDPTQDIELSSEGRFFIEKINSLETSDRQVVYMRFVDDLKPKEIAEILNLSPNVVSVRLNRAIEKLREMVGIDLQENE